MLGAPSSLQLAAAPLAAASNEGSRQQAATELEPRNFLSPLPDPFGGGRRGARTRSCRQALSPLGQGCCALLCSAALCCALLRSAEVGHDCAPQAQLAALTRIVGAPSLQIASSPSPSPSLPFDTHLDLNLSISTLHPSHLHYTRFPRVADLVREPVPPPPLSSSSASAFSRFCIQHPCRSGSASRGKSIPFLSSTLGKLHNPSGSLTICLHHRCRKHQLLPILHPCPLATISSASATTASSRDNSQVYLPAPFALGPGIDITHRPAHSSPRRELRVLACFT